MNIKFLCSISTKLHVTVLKRNWHTPSK